VENLSDFRLIMTTVLAIYLLLGKTPVRKHYSERTNHCQQMYGCDVWKLPYTGSRKHNTLMWQIVDIQGSDNVRLFRRKHW